MARRRNPQRMISRSNEEQAGNNDGEGGMRKATTSTTSTILLLYLVSQLLQENQPTAVPYPRSQRLRSADTGQLRLSVSLHTMSTTYCCTLESQTSESAKSTRAWSKPG